MLKVRLGSIVEYALKNETETEKAVKEFFGKTLEELPLENQQMVLPLFNEWFIFDYKLNTGSRIIIDYYLKNPDNLSSEEHNELKQIIETQIYDCFEIEETKPGEWMDIWALYTGKKFKVYEVSLSTSLHNQRGSFYNRIAKISNKYYFVGSNPFLFPIVSTDRLRKQISLTNKNFQVTPKEPFKLFLAQINQKPNPDLSISKHDIKVKRNKLEKKFKQLITKYELNTSFKQLVDFLYEENYKDHFADYYIDITAIGIPEKMVVKNTKFFQDLWNYFPHKKLGNKCPAEKVREIYG